MKPALTPAIAKTTADPASTRPRDVLDPDGAIARGRDAQMRVRIDSFAVPDRVRAAFDRQMAEVLAFLSTLDGYRGHLVFEKRDGDSRFDVITMVAWDSREAQERAGGQVRAFFRSRRLDIPHQLDEWGVEMLRADYEAAAGVR